MRVAITAQGKDLDTEMDPRFGRAQYILIVDTDGTIVDVIDNEENRAAMGGAGISAAKRLADRKVDVLLTGSTGPNARAALGAAGIAICEGKWGTARQALERFNSGDVSYLSSERQDAAGGLSGVPGSRGMGGGRGMGMGRGRGRGGGGGRGRGTG
ncbi:MAG: NifB/NifX family molybdenum-iron cluster-binding protein [Desulfomonilaceae bacterium]|nr:NifB/NifX family molybdenum-iron cluster-binding protein [Desulfomonilaceae bacterium]